MSDWPMDALAKTLFLETDVDLAANMYLRLDSWFKDGLCSRDKNVEAARRWPDRFLTYVGVSPTRGSRSVCAISRIRCGSCRTPSNKLYPDEVEPFRSWRMDDPKLAYPLFERAKRLIRTVADS